MFYGKGGNTTVQEGGLLGHEKEEQRLTWRNGPRAYLTMEYNE